MNPEYPIFSTTLCYLERDDAYLMLHRVKKEDDYNHDKWVGVGGKFERFESPEDCLPGRRAGMGAEGESGAAAHLGGR